MKKSYSNTIDFFHNQNNIVITNDIVIENSVFCRNLKNWQKGLENDKNYIFLVCQFHSNSPDF